MAVQLIMAFLGMFGILLYGIFMFWVEKKTRLLTKLLQKLGVNG